MAYCGKMMGCLLSICLIFGDHVFAQTKLEWKFPAETPLRQQLVQTTKVDVTPPGKKDVFTSQIDQTWLLESQADRELKDGVMEVRQHFSQIGMTVQLPPPISKRFSVDTSRPLESEDKTEQNMHDVMSKVIGFDWMVAFQKNGEIRKVSLSDTLTKLLVENPNMGPLMETFSETGLRKLAEQVTVTFPDKPVKKGDQWEQLVTNDFPDGKLVTKRICTFDGTASNGLSKISVRLEAEFQPSKEIPRARTLTAQSGRGEVYFDIPAGHIVRSRFEQNLVLQAGTKELLETQKLQLTTLLIPVDDAKPGEANRSE